MNYAYLSAEELLIIHALIIDETGGTHGVRDVELFKSIIEKPKSSFEGKDLYPDIFSKAVTFTEGLVNYHIFVDGNKRTGFAALVRFLEINGYELSSTLDEIEKTMIGIADKSLSADHIEEWISKHIAKKV